MDILLDGIRVEEGLDVTVVVVDLDKFIQVKSLLTLNYIFLFE